MNVCPSKKVVLASSSPRRQMLLKMLGIDFLCKPAETDETIFPTELPLQAVKRIARQKAEFVAGTLKEGIIISADTIVLCGGEILGKPLDKNDAFLKLLALKGRSHDVITAICIKDVISGNCQLEAETTRVYFRNISEKEIWEYISTGEPMDKAGAYGIQGIGSILISRIEGCYFNVMGLPLSRLYIMLKRYGVNLLEDY